MNVFLPIIAATVIAVPGVTFAQSDASAPHVDTSADPSSRLPVEKIDYPALRQSTESTAQYEKQRREPHTDVILSPYSPPIHDVKHW
ncbi:hypothetical protein [Paraburkholderia ferrariae]|uniref:hypothetical protein n=1 Tax=Paraburkholderia ferrariae TaxID=386056 RepID=UPI0012EC59E8|nr:hypothetical protein [Paraburkholderia ferrariae]